MKLSRFIYISLLFLAIPVIASAQLSTQSLDPEGDSIAFAQMRVRMDRIRRTEHRPTVALVLSGGGAKGAAHAGALKLIEELDIPIDMILGTSMGGLVGGLYSLGYNSAYLDSLLTSVDWSVILSDKVPKDYISYSTKAYKDQFALSVPFHYSREAFMTMTGVTKEQMERKKKEAKGEKQIDIPANNLMRSLPAGYINGLNVNNVFCSMSAGYQDSISFQELPIPFCCVASDMVTCKAKNWTSGSITEALRSTMSIPGLFDPVRTHGMVLVDGGTRNNFPTDIAREMGADYIIGVELSDKSAQYNDINNIADILFNFISMLGAEAFSKNVGNTDVFIKPDLHEFNMLSFDTESVHTIIQRGYEAALKQKDALVELKSHMPDASLRLKKRPADDINRQSLQISSIEFSGMQDRESRYLSSKIKIRAGDIINKAMIDKALAVIFATGAFESVTYQLLGDSQPYRLKFNAVKKPIHQLGLGFRADNESYVDVIFNVGLNYHQIAGPKFDFTGKLGVNKYARAHFSFDYPHTPTFNIDAKVSEYTCNVTSVSNIYRHNYWGHKEEVYLSNMHLKKIDINAGARNLNLTSKRWLSNSGFNVPKDTLKAMSGNYTSLFFYGRTNTLDDLYFPMRGIDFDLGYDWVFWKANKSDFRKPHIAFVNMKGVINMGRYAALELGVSGRAILNYEGSDVSDIALKNFIGGAMRGRYLSQQIPFCGFGDVTLVDNYVAAVNAALRFRCGEKLFLTFEGGAFKDKPSFDELIKFDFKPVFGACAELGYKTIAGPLKLDVRWSDYFNKIGVYLSFGYDF